MSTAVRTEPAWHGVARAIHLLLFLAIIIGGLAAGILYVKTHSDGLSRPTATHTQPFSSHGRTVYITPQQKQRVQWLMSFVLPGIPIMIGLSLALMLCGVKLFDTTSSPKEAIEQLPPHFRDMVQQVRAEAQSQKRPGHKS